MSKIPSSILKDYKPVMYKSIGRGTPHPLATGDIFKLDLAFFKKFSRYPEILGIIEAFSKDKDYTSGFWTILNKPCDMVHDPEGSRYFDDNLILCPLRNFLSCFDPDGPLFDCVQKQSAEILPHDMIIQRYENFCNVYLNKNLVVKGSPEEKKLVIGLRKQVKDSMISFFENIFTETDITIAEIENQLTGSLQTIEPEILAVLKLEDFISSLVSDAKWKQYVKRLNTEKIESATIKLKKSGLSKISNITLNQVDTQGLFYFEPHKKLINKDEFSYLVELQELLTWKIKRSLVKSGDLNEALLANRILSLTDNFSDRLLNIMGNYFSKIGTNDVSSAPIVRLYEVAFKDRFTVIEEVP